MVFVSKSKLEGAELKDSKDTAAGAETTRSRVRVFAFLAVACLLGRKAVGNGVVVAFDDVLFFLL